MQRISRFLCLPVDVSNAVYRDGQTRPLQLACDPRVDSPHAVMDKTYRVIWSRYDSVIKSSKKYSVNIKRFSLAIINPGRFTRCEYRYAHYSRKICYVFRWIIEKKRNRTQ